jgi:hypothetical protein
VSSEPIDAKFRSVAVVGVNAVLALPVFVLEQQVTVLETLSSEIATWEAQRNQQKASVYWGFKTKDARKKMQRLYPSI